jgi:uncharacterized protein (DUF488 family)
MTSSTRVIYTIGHSNRSLHELVALLRGAAVQTVVDTRSVPGSRRYPHFSEDNLRAALGGADMVYHWAGRQLGGHRPTHSDSVHTALTSDGLRAFADYMDTEAFRKGAQQLLQFAGRTTLALLCAERLPQDCHRSLIADYLVACGARVNHLIDPGHQVAHRLSVLARWVPPRLIYDRLGQAVLRLDS